MEFWRIHIYYVNKTDSTKLRLTYALCVSITVQLGQAVQVQTTLRSVRFMFVPPRLSDEPDIAPKNSALMAI